MTKFYYLNELGQVVESNIEMEGLKKATPEQIKQSPVAPRPRRDREGNVIEGSDNNG